MTINFTIMNTTSSEVCLKINGFEIASQFVTANSRAEFSLTDVQINNADDITIENSDIIYDITDACKQKVRDYVKPVYKLEPDSGTYSEEDDLDQLLESYECYDDNDSGVNGFADDKYHFEASDDDDLSWK